MENKKASFYVDGVLYMVELRHGLRGRSHHARAYVWGNPADDRSPAEEFAGLVERLGLDSVYTKRDDYPEMDKAFDRLNREIVKDKRQVLTAALTALQLEPEKVSFSRKAGCSCGCSPGFVLRGVSSNYTVFVNRVE